MYVNKIFIVLTIPRRIMYFSVDASLFSVLIHILLLYVQFILIVEDPLQSPDGAIFSINLTPLGVCLSEKPLMFPLFG